MLLRLGSSFMRIGLITRGVGNKNTFLVGCIDIDDSFINDNGTVTSWNWSIASTTVQSWIANYGRCTNSTDTNDSSTKHDYSQFAKPSESTKAC